MRISHRSIVVALLTTSFLFVQGSILQPDYRKIFGEHYESALYFINSHRWIADSLKNKGIDPCTGLPIIFPELIRYSSIRDKIETAALQSLYIQYGKYYADFSIGYFQMKPSFAEKIEKECLKSGECFNYVIDTANNSDTRKARIKRISSLEGQVSYLCMFIKIMRLNYPQLASLGKADEVRLLAAAYNNGYKGDFKGMETISRKSFFYIGIISPSLKYNYSDIAVEFLINRCEKY